MSDQRVIYSSPGNDRYESRDLWAHCPKQLIRDEYGAGKHFETDFMGKGVSDFTATQATAGTFAVDTSLEGGVAVADCNSTTATQGINVQADGAAFVPAAGVKVWFEARVKAADIATGPEFFLGLSEVDTTLIAASAVSSANFIGFFCTDDDNVLHFGTEDGGSQTAVTSGVHTLVDDTYVKLGFLVDGLTAVHCFVNGSEVTSAKLTSNVADVALVPSLVCQSGGTTDPIVYMDWIKVYQRDAD